MINTDLNSIQRPKILTILCWLTFIFDPIFIIISIVMIAENEGTSKFSFEQADIVDSILIGIPIFIGAIGLYKMKKWGAWIYIGAQAIGAFMSFSQAAKYNAIIDESPFLAFLIPGLCIGIVIYYYKYFSGNDFPLFNSSTNPVTANTNTFTDTSVSNILSKENNTIEEIEKLFQMKEKGIITEEDFKLMKEKIINSN